jgi:hypothetical protein
MTGRQKDGEKFSSTGEIHPVMRVEVLKSALTALVGKTTSSKSSIQFIERNGAFEAAAGIENPNFARAKAGAAFA